MVVFHGSPFPLVTTVIINKTRMQRVYSPSLCTLSILQLEQPIEFCSCAKKEVITCSYEEDEVIISLSGRR